MGPHLEEVFSRCEGRIIVTSFASNIHRVQQVVDAAGALGRKVVARRPLDAQERQHRPPARAHRRAGGPARADAGDRRLPRRQARDHLHGLPGRAAVGAAADGAPRPPAGRAARRATRSSSRPRRSRATSARSTTRWTGSTTSAATSSRPRDAPVHASGHGYAEEVKLMLNLVRPRYVMPFHGDFKRIHLHAKLAEAVGRGPGRHLQGRERAAAGARRARARASARASSRG